MRVIPKGWHKYQPLGECVAGTKFIAFKVPLRSNVCTSHIPKEKDWFTPTILLQKHPGIKAIIDLTDTSRYYDPQEFRDLDVTHVKINVAGGGKLPPSDKMRQFFEVVDEFMERHTDDPDALIGVHCTHGLNRTGYFVCNYMVNRLKMTAEDAIAQFESARGHTMERQKLVQGIKLINVGGEKVKKVSTPICRNYDQYRSPLDDAYEDLQAPRGFASWRNNKPRESESNPSSYNRLPKTDPYGSQRNYSNATRNRNRRRFGNCESGSSSSSGNWRERP